MGTAAGIDGREMTDRQRASVTSTDVSNRLGTHRALREPKLAKSAITASMPMHGIPERGSTPPLDYGDGSLQFTLSPTLAESLLLYWCGLAFRGTISIHPKGQDH